MSYIVILLLLLLPVVSQGATNVSIAAQGATGPGLCSITRQFSQTDMAAWNTTPLTLVPTPGTGLTIFPITITAGYDPASTRYTFGATPGITLKLGNVIFQGFDDFASLFDATPTYPHVLQKTIVTTTQGNLIAFVATSTSAKTTALRLTTDTAINAGDGNVIISVQYYLLNSDGTLSGQCITSVTGAPDGVTVGVGGNSGGPVLGETGAGDVDVAAHSNQTSAGTLTNPWSGWEVILATNRDGATCTTPSGYSVPTCLWASGKKYYFRTGNYYQVYPVAFTNTANSALAPSNTFVEGSARGLARVYYNPIDDGTSAFTLGKLGTHTLNTGFSKMTLIGWVGNPFKKVMIHTVDTTAVNIEDNTAGNWCEGAFSRGIWLQGREFVWVKGNRINTQFPFYVDGQPVTSEGGTVFPESNPYNNVGYSRFDNNEFIVCGFATPAIQIGATTVLNDVVFSGNSLIFGSDGLKWVTDFTGISDPNRQGPSHNVVIENFDWEQVSDHANGDITGNGWLVNIDHSKGNENGLTSLVIRQNHYTSSYNLADGYTINGVRLVNVHNVEISGLHQFQSARVCGRALALTNVHNVKVSGLFILRLPIVGIDPEPATTTCTGLITNQIHLTPPVCKTFQIPLSSSYGGKNPDLPAEAMYDIPASGGSCL